MLFQFSHKSIKKVKNYPPRKLNFVNFRGYCKICAVYQSKMRHHSRLSTILSVTKAHNKD